MLTPSEQHAAARCQPISQRDYFPFTVRVEVRENGQWVPQAQGNTYAWLREQQLDAARYGPTRLVTTWGEEVTIPAKRYRRSVGGLPAQRFHKVGW